jgi:selenocysteine lyase/cysteine desulfurase
MGKCRGVRVTPHIYTPIKDLEKVVKVIQEIAFDIPKNH